MLVQKTVSKFILLVVFLGSSSLVSRVDHSFSSEFSKKTESFINELVDSKKDGCHDPLLFQSKISFVGGYDRSLVATPHFPLAASPFYTFKVAVPIHTIDFLNYYLECSNKDRIKYQKTLNRILFSMGYAIERIKNFEKPTGYMEKAFTSKFAIGTLFSGAVLYRSLLDKEHFNTALSLTFFIGCYVGFIKTMIDEKDIAYNERTYQVYLDSSDDPEVLEAGITYFQFYLDDNEKKDQSEKQKNYPLSIHQLSECISRFKQKIAVLRSPKAA